MTQVDKSFSEGLLKQLQKGHPQNLNLSSSEKLFSIPHPLVLKAQISDNLNPQQDYPIEQSFMGWNAFFYSSLEKKEDEEIIRAHPFQIFKILQVKPSEVILNFDELGCVKLTQNKMLEVTTSGIHQKVLPIILDYIFSPDLWSEKGKWTRFHQRLNRIFDKYELAFGPNLPGRYSLNNKATRLQKLGVKGDEVDGKFVVTLPWTFSLSNLELLEKIFEQEF